MQKTAINSTKIKIEQCVGDLLGCVTTLAGELERICDEIGRTSGEDALTKQLRDVALQLRTRGECVVQFASETLSRVLGGMPPRFLTPEILRSGDVVQHGAKQGAYRLYGTSEEDT